MALCQLLPVHVKTEDFWAGADLQTLCFCPLTSCIVIISKYIYSKYVYTHTHTQSQPEIIYTHVRKRRTCVYMCVHFFPPLIKN